MKMIDVRRTGALGATLVAVALPSVASAQQQSDFTKSMGIEQRLGGAVPKSATFLDELGRKRTFGSLFQGRPLLVLPFPLKRTAGCGVILDGLQKTLFRAANPNVRKLVKKEGRNQLQVGKDFDVVLLSLDPTETPTDAAATKADFQKKLGVQTEPVTALTGNLMNIRQVTDALGFRFYYNPGTKALRNPTGSVLVTPDGHISSYTIGNDFQTVVLERNLELARTNAVGTKAEDTEMFACVQLDAGIIEKRGRIEALYTWAGLITLGTIILWISSMLRSERNSKPLGGQPGA